jgi:hypothetical protein
MPLSTYLLIVSGISSVALTIWGRIIPPDSGCTKSGFIGVGVLSVLCITCVFDICGGNHRLIVAFKFSANVAFIKFIGTHAQYDRVNAATVSQF